MISEACDSDVMMCLLDYNLSQKVVIAHYLMVRAVRYAMSTISSATTMDDTEAATRLLIAYVLLPVMTASFAFWAAPERRISINVIKRIAVWLIND